MKLLIKQIQFIEAQISDIENEIDIILEKIDSPITTIPGIENIIAKTILGKIYNINKLSNACKLANYAGIDASISQSGDFKSTNNQMSKRGSPYLRKVLFQANLVAAFNTPVFSAFYQKKRNKGKHII